MKKEDESEDTYSDYRTLPWYVILICGIIISGVGIYLIVTQQIATGIIYSGRFHTGIGVDGRETYITGNAALIIGILMSLFSIYQLIEISKNKNQ